MNRLQRQDGFPVGQRIKALREALGLSQRELARRAQITNANLSMIEQAKVSPAMSTLEKILAAMEIDLPNFFASAEPLAPVVKGESFSLVRRKGAKFWIMQAAGGENRYLARAVIEPGAKVGRLWLGGPGLVTGVLLAGRLDLLLNDACHELVEGDGFEFMLSRKHGFNNVYSEPVSLVIAVDAKP